MKKKSFVEWMTSFISNMRVERVEESKKPESELFKWFKNKVDMFTLGTSQSDPTNVHITLDYNNEYHEETSKLWFSFDDLSEDLKEAFIAAQPIHFVLNQFEVNNVEYEVCWDLNVGWDFSGEADNTLPIASADASTLQPVSYEGTCSFKAPGESKVEGLDAVAKIVEKLFLSGEVTQQQVFADLTIDGSTMRIALGGNK